MDARGRGVGKELWCPWPRRGCCGSSDKLRTVSQPHFLVHEEGRSCLSRYLQFSKAVPLQRSHPACPSPAGAPPTKGLLFDHENFSWRNSHTDTHCKLYEVLSLLSSSWQPYKEIRSREGKRFAQGHKAYKEWNHDVILGHLTLNPALGRDAVLSVSAPVLTALWTSLVAQTVKHLPTMWETWVWSLGPEDPLEKGMATHSDIRAWRIPWTEPGGL